MSDIKKANYPAALSSSISYPVNLSDNILAQYDQNALPILILLRQNLKDQNLHDPVDIPIQDHTIHIYKKEPTIYNGRLLDKFGTVFEFKDQTLPIVSSMIAAKLEILNQVDEAEEKAVDEVVTDSAQLDSAPTMAMAEPTPPPPQEVNSVPAPPKGVRMHICPDGHINIEILKSLGEKNLMKDTLEIYEAVEKAAKPQQADPAAAAGAAGGDDQEDPQAGMLDEEGHEYLKSSDHDGGKQYWYKDPETGKVLEKPNAPKGHADYDMNPSIEEMSDQVASLTKMVKKLQKDVAAVKAPKEEGKAPKVDDAAPKMGGKAEEKPLDDKDPNAKVDGKDLKPAGGDEGVDKDGEQLETENKLTNEKRKESLKDGVENDDKDMETVDADGTKDKKEPEVEGAPKKDKKKDDKVAKALKAKYPTLSGEKIDQLVKAHQEKSEVKQEVDPIRKALKDKYPTLSDKKIDELVQKAMKKGDVTKKEAKEIAQEEAGSAVKMHNKKLHKEESDKDGNATKDVKDVKKSSRLQRMWKVFSIEMPEELKTKDDVKKANAGASILKSRIMNQGKDDPTAENIVRNTLKEKYGDVFKSVVLFKEAIQSPTTKKQLEAVEKSRKMDAFTVNEEVEIQSPAHMHELRKMDSDVRFGQPVYKSAQETLVREVKSNVNEQVVNLTKAKPIDWSDRKDKEYSEGDVKKSLNGEKTQLDHMVKARTDANWNIPEWKPEGEKALVQEVKSDVNDKVAKSRDASKNKKDVDWSDMGHKLFDEDQVKKSLNGPKTKKEKEKEEVIKSLWSIADGDQTKNELVDEAVKLLKSARTAEELDKMTVGQRQTALVKALQIVKARYKAKDNKKPDLMKPNSIGTSGVSSGTISQPAASTIATFFRKKSKKEAKADMKKALQEKYPTLSETKVDEIVEKAYCKYEDMTKVEGHGSYVETPEFFQEGFGGQDSKGDWKGQEKDTNLEKEAAKTSVKMKENEDTEGQDPQGGSRKDLSDKKTL